MTTLPKVGWIGLGAMGSGMAFQLCQKTFPVTAYDVYPPSLEKAVQAGATAASSPAEAAKGVQILGLMPVNKDQVEDVLFGTGGVAEVLEPGASVVCFSTVPPSFLVTVQERLDLLGKGNGIVDAPVSGGSTRAAAGTLAIMVSGSAGAIETARPMLAALTQAPEGAMTIVGDSVGGASGFKCINQVLCAIQIGMASESMAFAKALGMNQRLVYNTIHTAGSSGDSFMFGHRVPWQFRSDGIPKSAMTIISKDIGIVMDESRLANFPMPLCAAAEQLYTACIGAGLQREDDGLAIKIWDSFGIKHEYESGSVEEETEKAKELVVQPTKSTGNKILVVGLGVMGLGMAKSLLKNGLTVCGHDVRLEAMDAFAKEGGTISSDILEAAKGSDIVLLMPNTAAQAELILFGVDGTKGMASVLPEGATVIISSTVSPSSAVRLQSLLSKLDRGLELVDAPVSGGPSRASVGDLTIFASGTESALSKAYGTLEAMSGAAGKSQNVHFIPGGVGSGSKMKCINNHLAGVHLCAAAEAMAFAQRQGMNLKQVYEVVSKGAAYSYVMVDRMPRIWQSQPPVHSAVDTFVKDLGLVLGEAKKAGCPLWMCAAAHQQFVTASGMGWGAEDDSWVSKLWEKMGVSVALDRS